MMRDADSASAPETHSFQAEVAKLLHLMVHSVYSEKEVFLRELISNGSDACDKLRYRTVVEPGVIEGEPNFRIVIRILKDDKILQIADNGIGMSHDDLIENLGTIARSGTAEFISQLPQDSSKNAQLIGQFGVGFYSAFMVADRVDVISLKCGEDTAWQWSSDGTGQFELRPADNRDALLDGRGTVISLHLKKDALDFLNGFTLRRVISEYSDHITFPVYLKETPEDEGDGSQVNKAGALWARTKSDIEKDQYKEFYHGLGAVFDDPWLIIHYRAEGRHEYTVLLFVPTSQPMDLFDPKRATRLKLYVKRVYITDDADLLPGYLRFVRGVIDSEDMPLNISREMLQNNPIVANIRNAVTKRLLSELAKKKDSSREDYEAFWRVFGAVVKEGLYEDPDRRDSLLDLALFRSTKGDGLRSLKDYVEDMKENQTAIYYIRGDDADSVGTSPQLEGYRARGIEVLLLSDPIDAFWTTAVDGYDGKPFKSVAHGAADLDQFGAADKGTGDKAQDETPESDVAVSTLIALFKQALEGKVADVRRSNRLTESAVCLVADENAMDLYMERILAQSTKGGAPVPDPLAKRILEINPKHGLVRKLAELAREKGAGADITDAAFLLLDQARILEGEPVVDAGQFSKRLTSLLERAV